MTDLKKKIDRDLGNDTEESRLKYLKYINYGKRLAQEEISGGRMYTQAEVDDIIQKTIESITSQLGDKARSNKENIMSLDAIKATAFQAVTDAVEQAYAQGVEDTKVAQAPTEGEVTIPTQPVDVDAIAKANYQQGILDENKRVTALVQESIKAERATEDALADALKLQAEETAPTEPQPEVEA
jgi:hypothetical protein